MNKIEFVNFINEELSHSLNYPEYYRREHWYIDYCGWNTGRRKFLWELAKITNFDDVELKIMTGADKESLKRDDGWGRIFQHRKELAWLFLAKKSKFSEKELKKEIMSNGIALSDSESGAPGVWLKAVRFRKVIDWYAVDKTTDICGRKVYLMQLLVNQTGYQPWDFI